jgi:hypothetical protein
LDGGGGFFSLVLLYHRAGDVVVTVVRIDSGGEEIGSGDVVVVERSYL